MPKPFYITTTLPYVNSDPHIGFAMEIVRADAVARYKKLKGFDVFFNTGTDEHGMKIWQKAKEKGVSPKAYVDEWAEKFKQLKTILHLDPELHFIRTTDDYHEKSAREFWKVCSENGHIYKKNYKIKYCVGCELEKTESELKDGKCPEHPNLSLEEIEEENYFFRFSVFQKPLLELYAKKPDFVVPDFRFNEIKAFVERGLQDFSISRLKSKMPWGIEVPGDSEHVMYVWFDALVNYVSAIGWPHDMDKFEKWGRESGGMVQYCGKDNLRQQSAMWQAMLMGAGLPNSGKVVVDGFITGEGGIKMSKSLGNTVNPAEIVAEYGAEALRYFLIREIHPFEDGPFTKDGFKNAYNAGLANGLGNLFARVMTMAEKNGFAFDDSLMADKSIFAQTKKNHEDYAIGFEEFNLQKSANAIWEIIAYLDQYIQKEQPFKKVKTDKSGAERDIKFLLAHLMKVGEMLKPMMPDTAEKIQTAIAENKKPAILFPRKE